jgi:hypothetical protein
MVVAVFRDSTWMLQSHSDEQLGAMQHGQICTVPLEGCRQQSWHQATPQVACLTDALA